MVVEVNRGVQIGLGPTFLNVHESKSAPFVFEDEGKDLKFKTRAEYELLLRLAELVEGQDHIVRELVDHHEAVLIHDHPNVELVYEFIIVNVPFFLNMSICHLV